MSRSNKLYTPCGLLSAILLSAAACGDVAPQPGDSPAGIELAKSSLVRATTPGAGNVPTLGANNTEFAFDLYQGIAAEPANAGKNLVFSPYSVSTALAMTYEGARGTTESEMKTALHFDLAKPALHEALNATDLALTSRGVGKVGADGTPFRLNVNNSIWAQRGANIVPAFLDVLAVNYGAGVFLADFATAPDASRKAINAWVSDKTEQLIPELLQPSNITPDTRFVLTNTVYFNAGWQQKFAKEKTADAPFTKLDGSTVTSKLMSGDIGVSYAEGDDYRAIALPYEDNQLRFVAVLPSEGKLSALEQGLSAAWLASVGDKWTTTSATVFLPQLDFELRTGLVPQLKKLGMRAAFESADFSGMTSEGIVISDVIHQAVLKVFEGGTIAAAATAVIATRTSKPVAAPTVRFDRPFLFAIVDEPTGAILFLGRVLDPTAK